jgi:ribosomal protein L7/L12
VSSIGSSGVGLVRSLRRVMPLPETDIAALLFQAPSALITGLDRSLADAIAGSLRETGLDCGVLEGDAPLEEGVGDCEVALHVHDFARMPAIVLEVMRLLGVDERTARKIVCAVPAALLGGVSTATVHALRQRFAPLGAEVDASRSASARFDVFLGACPGVLRERALARIRALARDAAPSEIGDGVLSCVDRETAEGVLQELGSLSAPLCIVNRDFARYTLWLQRAQDGEALRACLSKLTGMPSQVVPRVLASLPLVLHHGVSHADAEAALTALADAGAEASADPVALQRFALALEPVREPGSLLPLLRDLGGLAETDALDVLRSRTPRVPGPFTSTHARWLAHELERAGARVKLELQ